MRPHVTACILLFVTLFAAAVTISAAEPEGAPSVDNIMKAGRDTLKKLRTSPASWTVRCQLPSAPEIEIQVVADRDRRSLSFLERDGLKLLKLCRITEIKDVWYIQEKGRSVKTRPYAAELHFPAAYLLLSMAELHCCVHGALLESAKFQGRSAGQLSYRIPLPARQRLAFEYLLSEYEKSKNKDTALAQNAAVEQAMQLARERLTNGLPLSVDEQTGILTEVLIGDMTVITEGFHWLDAAPKKEFEFPKGFAWEDQTPRWSRADLQHCILVSRDPAFAFGNPGKPQLDGYVLNLKTEELRRIPFPGFLNSPGCFLSDHRHAIVMAFDPMGGVGFVRMDLATGQGEAINFGELFNGSISLFADLSPDGKKIATIRSLAGGSIGDLQIQTIEVKTGIARDIGKPGPIGTPFSWLPDGSGLILKRTDPTNGLSGVERRSICRLDLNGTLTELCPGDWPVVLRKSRKILYEDTDTMSWHTCNFDGSGKELYADGLKGYEMPTPSPDESQIVFVHYDKGKLPQLTLFDLGNAKGKPVGHAEGFTTVPIWR